MNILQISSAREIGGGERHLIDLITGLARRGHVVHAALVPSSPLLTELASLLKENVLELPMRNAFNLKSAMRLSRFVQEQRIEIVHAHLGRDYPLAALVAGRSRARLVLTRHVLFPLSRIHRLTLRRTARVIAVSKAIAAGLREQGIFDPQRIVVIHNGVDVERFANSNEKLPSQEQTGKGQLRVGMIGSLAPIKGQEDFIRAAAVVCRRRDDVEFIIAGLDHSPSGENRRSLEELIDDLGLNRRVRMIGWADDVARLLSTLDLFVSPSRLESFGLSIVEAMAAGTPVVTTASAGAREIIDDNRTGRLVPVGDTEALANSISELLTNPEQCRSLAANAMRLARERFSLERMIDEIEAVYQQILAQ